MGTDPSRHSRLAPRAALALIVALVVCLPGTASAAQTVRLTASFRPDRLGAHAAFALGFKLGGTPAGQIPSPLTGLELRLPGGLGLFTSTLGEALCPPAVLLAGGVKACPDNAIMGYGTATAEVPYGPEVLEVPIKIEILMGPPSDHHTGVLYYGESESDVIAPLMIPSVVQGDAAPYGTLLDMSLPLTPGLPETPDAAITQMHAAIGPSGLRYSRRVNGRRVTFHPQSMAVPTSCPANGFPVAATFHFQNGVTIAAKTAVPCPRRSSHRRARRR